MIKFLLFLGFLLVVVLVITQVVVPALRERRLFPLFRQADAREGLLDARARKDDAAMGLEAAREESSAVGKEVLTERIDAASERKSRGEL